MGVMKLNLRLSLRIFLKNAPESGYAIKGMRRVSRPGRRVYVGKDRIPIVKNGFGIAVLSTSRGVMTGRDASKAGVVGFTRDLATKWARHGINVNAIAPAVFRSALTQWVFEDTPAGEDSRRRNYARIPLGREVALAEQGIALVRAKVGDRYVLEELAARRWLLGGESSGHLLALDRHSTGDGIVSALQVLQAVQHSGRSLQALLETVRLYPQVMINVRLKEGADWRQNTRLAELTERLSAELGRQGRVLIRASGTEPVLRVMVEAREESQARRAAEALAAAARGE